MGTITTTGKQNNKSSQTTTLKVLAEACGVSIGAVSQCLRNPDNTRFSEATRRMIQSKARELNYIPNRLAAGLREGRTRFLSMVVPWNTPEMLDSAELEAKAHDYGLSIHFTVSPDLDAERKAIQYALGQRVDGLIWLPSDTAWGYTRTLKRLRESNTQTVFLESSLPGLPEAGLVEVDYETPLLQVLEAYSRSGCRQLVYFTPGAGHQMRARRVAVFEGFCKRHGLEGQIVVCKGESGRATIHQTLASLPRPCGVICDGDWPGLDAVQYAAQAGLRFPEDMQLVVVGDILIGGRFRVGEICSPGYSAIRRPSGEMAREGVRILIHALEHPDEGPLPRKLLNSEWIPRETGGTG